MDSPVSGCFWVCGSNPSHLTISWWTPSKGSASCSARSLHDLTKKPGKNGSETQEKHKPCREWTKGQDSWKVWNQQTKKNWGHMAIPAPRDVYALRVPRVRPIRGRRRHAAAWLQRARCCNQGELSGPWAPTQTAIWTPPRLGGMTTYGYLMGAQALSLSWMTFPPTWLKHFAHRFNHHCLLV